MLHQGAKLSDNVQQRETVSFIHRLEHEVMNLPTPDILLYLSIPAKIRMELLQKQHADNGRELDVAEINVEHQSAVDDAAETMLSMYSNSAVIECMDGEVLLPKEKIADRVFESVEEVIRK